ncbi:Protein of unknown function [Mesobacillus persicus]|uniref:DUF2515 domain-containing protein n=1 Tax=Mesobacillus persicus TaxID=930146 RepID=A0A1H7W015_9BACI|nr:DUF2515 domain-containing protein [Mesobacillus persicus]SEM14459.1 Protein of unknown function [Mesobacillus persicus]
MFLFNKDESKSLSPSLLKIKKELKKQIKKPSLLPTLTPTERNLVKEINEQTNTLNKNNITRTKAYLDFYQEHPEIHWSFMAHMVSRNGGYNMTDLKGGFLSKLMTLKERKSFFYFLERSNWLIFQDAFPQLLLYKKSLGQSQNLFHLLPHLRVSTFMETVWNHFWKIRDSSLVTIALVINEQSYLESRVVQNPVYKEKVLSTFEFKLQDLLSMNHILFPYSSDDKTKLVGNTVHHFESMHERILIGKRLYKILFGDQERLKAIESWAVKHPHTGSRMDYWPHLFHYVDEGVPSLQWKPRIVACKLTTGSPRIYSPKLELAWKDQTHEEAEIADWFDDWKVVYYLKDDNVTANGEIQSEYCRTLETLELAAIANKAVSIFD